MTRILFSVALALAGTVMILTRRRFSRSAIRWQNATWGLNLGEGGIKASEGSFVVLGVLLVLASLRGD
jgi:hypothetical protein